MVGAASPGSMKDKAVKKKSEREGHMTVGTGQRNPFLRALLFGEVKVERATKLMIWIPGSRNVLGKVFIKTRIGKGFHFISPNIQSTTKSWWLFINNYSWTH